MSSSTRLHVGFKLFPTAFILTLFCFAVLAVVISCSTGSTTSSGSGLGSATVSLSDPPSCAAPSGNFKHVYITIRSVQAHLSPSASDSTPGWQELATQLNTQPMQVDLLNLPQNGACLLAQLGSTSSLPVGDYQQIRLLLLANAAPTGPVPSTNACSSLGQVFNCVEDKNNVFHVLLLNSEANTGLKVPPGQIQGGPIHVAAGQSVDINLDFDTCNSLVPLPSGDFRLRPTLTAGQVSTNSTGISGQVIDNATLQPVPGALVALEQQDAGGIDRIVRQATADSAGRFVFCPLPAGAMFDVVVDAVNGALTYNATAVLNVPGGTSLSGIKLVPETSTPTTPSVLQGFVTAVNGTTGAKIDASLSAFQSVPAPGGGSRTITIPLLTTASQTSTPLVAVESSATCPAGSPTGAFCAQYTLVVPASNPSVGAFSAGSVTFSPPPGGDILYSVEAKATVPLSSNTPICSPAVQTTNQDSTALALKVTAGNTTTVKRLDFSGCV
jgi:hypothetical protein